MRKVLSIVCMVFALVAYGQVKQEISPEEWEECARVGRSVDAPDYFCECQLTATPFVFPLDTIVQDTMWFSTKLDDMQQGISAFWFGDCDLTFEVYAFCTSKQPTITFDVPAGKMYEMSAAQINERLDGMGTTARELAGSMTPMIRLYPHGCSGQAFAYPFNEGPASDCEDPLELRLGMRYVCDSTKRVMRMNPSEIPDKTQSFLRWRHWNNKACDIRLTLDSCEGEELVHTTLTDTFHVFWVDSAKLREAKQANRSVWLTTQTEKNTIGRMTWYEKPFFVEPDTLNDTTCMGKALKVHMIDYMSDTSFVDTIAVLFDTLRLCQVNLTFTAPELEYDTVYLDPITMKRGYRYKPSGDIFTEFGEYEVEVKKTGACTRAILLNILNSKEQGVEETEATRRKARKILRDGQLLIEIDKEIFDVFGQKII